jgi:hypothetical protein
MAAAINHSHGLKAHAFHVNLGRQQKTMVQIVEELITATKNISLTPFLMA